MELFNNHRQALLMQLEEAQLDRDNAIAAMRSEAANLSFSEACEVRDFLAKQRIDLIKKVLIANDIDY